MDSTDVQCPIFFAICGEDSVAPPGPSIKYARTAPQGQLHVFDGMGHFSIYVGEDFDKATKSYLSFLSQHLPVAA